MTLERVDVDDCPDRLQVVLHRNRYNFVLDRLLKNQRVLEIGTGTGTFSKELQPLCASYIGIEYDHNTCLKARKKTGGKTNIIEADARCLPFADDQFTFIVCLEVLEHLGDYQAGVKNIHRCLQPDGMAIMSVPYRRIGGKSKGNEHHPYEPGELELVALLKQLFTTVEVYYQYFEEQLWWTLARKLHLRCLLGLKKIYAGLSAGEPHLTSRFRIGRRAKGWKEGLVVVVTGKKLPSAL